MNSARCTPVCRRHAGLENIASAMPLLTPMPLLIFVLRLEEYFDEYNGEEGSVHSTKWIPALTLISMITMMYIKKKLKFWWRELCL
jgi:hypothetical protein